MNAKPQLDTAIPERGERLGRDSDSFIGLLTKKATKQIRFEPGGQRLPSGEVVRELRENLFDLCVEIAWRLFRHAQMPLASLRYAHRAIIRAPYLLSLGPGQSRAVAEQ